MKLRKEPTMSADVCRVCLASNNRMIFIYKSILQDIYEKLSSSKLRPGDRRPEMICYICYSQLQRCRTFSDMSQKSNRILSNLLYEGVVEVTPDTIAKLNLEPAYNLTATTIPFVSLNHIISTIDLPVKEELVKTEEVDEDVYTNNSFEEELPLTNENNLTDNVNNTDVQFVCEVCGNKCTTEIELMNHSQTHTERTFTLDSNNSFNTTNLKQQHEIVPLESNLFICDTCKKTFTDKHTLIHHIGIHVSKHHNTRKNTLAKHKMRTQSAKKPSYGCEICNKVFTRSNTLKEHTRTHTGEKPYVCDFCNKTFTFKNTIKSHLRIHIREKPFTSDSNNSFNTTKLTQQHKIVPLASQLFICDRCEKTFTDKHTLIQHIGIHMSKDHNTRKNTLTKHEMRTQSGKKLSYACDICNKVFTHSNTLKEHKRTHTGERPYVCDFCNKTFSVKNTMKSHLRIHIQYEMKKFEKPYGCGICNKTLSSKAALKHHKMNFHHGIKPYNCKSCDKAFTVKNTLTLHMRTHTGEKPYKCKTCDKRFSQRGSLYVHTKIHTGEKRFGCNKCDKSFMTKKYLKNHMIMHTGEKPYACNTCSKSFTQMSNLRRHQMTHSGEKPFKCKVCAKAVTQKSSLVSHMKIHNGENLLKPFSCDICSKTFAKKYRLVKHKKNHNKGA